MIKKDRKNTLEDVQANNWVLPVICKHTLNLWKLIVWLAIKITSTTSED